MLSSFDQGARFRAIKTALSAFIWVFALCGFTFGTRGAEGPRLVVMRAPNGIDLGGDSNNPAVWVGDRVQVFASPYAQEDKPAGVSYYRSGVSINQLDGRVEVEPDRSLLSAAPQQAFGPWFESVIADDEGVLWAYYHAEFGVDNGLHPRIGAQVSYDSGATWRDLGVIIDTPAGTDAVESHLGYGFIGGNGDFTAILDRDREYIYFFVSQYGATPEAQGIAVARMRWSDRAQPVGKVWKKQGTTWDEPGLGGATTPLLANLGDAHGVNAPIDFWWGPSVHWNYHLECYVILLSRATTGGFTSSGPANWVIYATDLTDESTWTAPVPVEFPDGLTGGWYPGAIGTEKYDTDNYLGREARLFVDGSSEWRAIFLRPGEEINYSDYPTLPEIALYAGDGSSNVIALRTGDTLPITSIATDINGDMTEHWLELRAPSGLWSWEGWLTSAPWDGALVDDGSRSTKSVNYTFTEPGEYLIRASTIDLNSVWVISDEIRVVVSGPDLPTDTPDVPVALPDQPAPADPTLADPLPLDPAPPPAAPEDPAPPPAPPEEPVNPPSSPSDPVAPALPIVTVAIDGLGDAGTATLGDTLVFNSVATDVNGDMGEHWLELWSPDYSWSWTGWLSSAPWLGGLDGDGGRSEKSASFTFSTAGTYIIRASAVDSQGEWVISPELSITVTER